MKKLNPSLLLAAAIALYANATLAQGTMLYTWNNMNHPQTLFQASFEINGSMPGTQPFEQNATGFTLTSPDHTFTQAAGEICLGPFTIIVSVNDPSFPGVAWLYPGSITEYAADGGVKFSEQGYWAYTAVPEPSVAAMLALGLLVKKTITHHWV